jgi:mRNA interferase RelE/StbE
LKFNIKWQPSSKRNFKKLAIDVQKKITIKLDELITNPRPVGCKKLASKKNRFRIRIGDYRIIYSVYDTELIIMVLEVGHRQNFYRGV